MVSVQPETPNEVDAKNSVLASLQKSGILPTKGMVTEKIAEGLASQIINTLATAGNEAENCVTNTKTTDINDMRKRVGLKMPVSEAAVGQAVDAGVAAVSTGISQGPIAEVGGNTNLDGLLKKLGITPMETGVPAGYRFDKRS